MLFDVSTSILIEAKNAEEAMQKVRYFLSGDYDVDINFLVHSAENDEGFSSLEALRNNQQSNNSCTGLAGTVAKNREGNQPASR